MRKEVEKRARGVRGNELTVFPYNCGDAAGIIEEAASAHYGLGATRQKQYKKRITKLLDQTSIAK
jgi:hypothetical protein